MPEWVPYLGAGVAYVTIGVFVPSILLAWFVCIGFLLLCVVVLPALLRRRSR